MIKDQQIDKIARTICNVCHTHTSCRKEGICTMAFVAAEGLYNEGFEKHPTAKWTLNRDGSGTCSNCHFTQRSVWDCDNFQHYCGCCGAKMEV